jgi:hypothetical protein
VGEVLDRRWQPAGLGGGTADRHRDQRGSGCDQRRRNRASPSAVPRSAVHATELRQRPGFPGQFGIPRTGAQRRQDVLDAPQRVRQLIEVPVAERRWTPVRRLRTVRHVTVRNAATVQSVTPASSKR